jgi:DNA-binding response OmpR family regulator
MSFFYIQTEFFFILQNMKPEVLIVEDESPLIQSITEYLSNSAVNCQVAQTYAEAVRKTAASKFDCVVIDIGLPDGSGIELLQHLRKKNYDAGIIIISARNSVEDKIEGLDKGADDFLSKPFHLSELNARINAVVRRKKTQGKSVLEFKEISAHPDSKDVFVNDQKVVLTNKEFELLIYFIANANKIITKEALGFALWKNNSDMASGEIIYSHIKNLRKKLVDKGSKDYIHAVYGIGYKFSEA